MGKKMEFGFRPYVGKDYYKASRNLLIVGASHYCASDDCDIDFTSRCMEKYLAYKQGVAESPGGWIGTFTKFANAAAGRKLAPWELVAFYQRVAFYNYLQEPEGATEKEKHPEKFNDPRHLCLFKKALHELEPGIVIVWGEKVWQALPEDLGKGRKQLSEDGLPGELHGRLWEYYMADGRPVIFCAVDHPSSPFFSHERFSPLLRRLNLKF